MFFQKNENFHQFRQKNNFRQTCFVFLKIQFYRFHEFGQVWSEKPGVSEASGLGFPITPFLLYHDKILVIERPKPLASDTPGFSLQTYVCNWNPKFAHKTGFKSTGFRFETQRFWVSNPWVLGFKPIGFRFQTQRF